MSDWPRAIMHLDMDAFYVNVHLLRHPHDAGKPLAVGGRPEQRGVVASASYEARAFGVRSAMPMKTAVRLCPRLTIVPADWEQIRASSAQVMALLAELGAIEPISVDEAYVDLSAQPDPASIAIGLREHVRLRTGLPGSVGLATSKLVAKIASDFDKPYGCTIVAPGDEAEFLAPLPARAIWGVGAVMAERLAAIGIVTCGDLARADLATLAEIVGSAAEGLQRRARGIDHRPVVTDHGPPKSISQEWTFSQDVAAADLLAERLRTMCDEVAHTLQRRQLLARTVTVKIRWPDFTTFTRQRSLPLAIDDADALYGYAELLWRDHWPVGKPLRLLGVGVSNLETHSGARQLTFEF